VIMSWLTLLSELSDCALQSCGDRVNIISKIFDKIV